MRTYFHVCTTSYRYLTGVSYRCMLQVYVTLLLHLTGTPCPGSTTSTTDRREKPNTRARGPWASSCALSHPSRLLLFVLRSCSVPFSRQACVFKHQTKVAKHFLVWCFFLTCERTRVPEGAAPGLGVRRCWLPRVRSRVEPCCRLVEVTTSAVEVTTIAPSKSQLAPSKSHARRLTEVC